ncbi:MAG: hypothetical protein A3B23_02890 [Candidatus Colwellbacteria bacterium RIFCSPLOWO2_01_FULL_48_10]|uniref:Calx-beta domain-containing protein n=1 Tax=Candidatus Colwellbacteria bacterium RIFCSPLOWO2_01_FULL_48_10 TaxID=1797690 RepID=A0A1G1Z5W0_9BACT|nr:MAG: hypothetical protein A3B23_02890 [Candidatus Colwellbacteria bacterium RIFCSPLOWO2_01_FULL_48_10]
MRNYATLICLALLTLFPLALSGCNGPEEKNASLPPLHPEELIPPPKLALVPIREDVTMPVSYCAGAKGVGCQSTASEYNGEEVLLSFDVRPRLASASAVVLNITWESTSLLNQELCIETGWGEGSYYHTRPVRIEGLSPLTVNLVNEDSLEQTEFYILLKWCPQEVPETPVLYQASLAQNMKIDGNIFGIE